MAQLPIREASRDDLDLLAAFTVEEAREAEGRVLDVGAARDGVAAAFAPGEPKVRYWIAGAPPVAAVSVTPEWSDWNAAPYWWIQSCYVVPAARGRGVIGALLTHVRTAAAAVGVAELRLLVHRDNARARAAYVRAGYQALPYEVMTLPLR
jgi:GNAT superfamily N-acetyltransferase